MLCRCRSDPAVHWVFGPIRLTRAADILEATGKVRPLMKRLLSMRIKMISSIQPRLECLKDRFIPLYSNSTTSNAICQNQKSQVVIFTST